MPSREDYEKFFKQADADNSGKLTLDELIDMMRKKGFTGPTSEIAKYFGSCDTSGDHEISMEEYLQAMGVLPPDVSKEAAIRTVFNGFDTSGDGTIDRCEIKAVLAELRGHNEVSEEEATRAAALIDTDGDGKITFEEFSKHFFNQ